MKRLNRFTTLPVLIDFLEREKLVLLNPSTWDDKNDSEIMEEYRKRRNLACVRALCFSSVPETIHHWKTFSDGISGCVIEFDAEKLFEIFNRTNGVRHGKVFYRKINEIKKGEIEVSDIPFTKRWPYRCEEEYRIIWEGDIPCDQFEINVPISCVNKITISQKMPEKVYETIKSLLQKTFKDPDKRINKSTIYENKIWINKFKDT